MFNTIPASEIVSVVPSVISAGGSALDLIGIALSNTSRVPIGSVLSFPSAQAVKDYFGSTTNEAIAAEIYFLAFDNSNVKPGAMLFTQYNQAAVNAYVRGGDISGLTLTALQALSGTLNVTIDGVLKTASVNLSAATSFSNAAEIIQTDLAIQGVQAAAFTGSISTTVLTVASGLTGTLQIGGVVTGSGVTVGTYIVAQLSGTPGGLGTYTVSASQTVGSEALVAHVPAVAYDSVSGGFEIRSGTAGAASTITFGSGAMGTSLLLTQATGALLSQGADAAVPAAFMDAVVQQTTNWVTFFTIFDPDASGNAVKQAFASWTNLQGNRYGYECWDTDITPTQSSAATTSLGYILKQNDSSGIQVLYTPPGVNLVDCALAAFACGCIAAIDFTELNGRITMAFKAQEGLVATVTDATKASNLLANGYNFYGAYGTANDRFVFLYNGSITGPFKWADSYYDQVWLNNQFQLALMVLLTQAKSVPYNSTGRALTRGACMDPINQGLNFGIFAPGVELSAAQKAEVNNAAGLPIDGILFSQGWYLQILPAIAQVRAARESPPMTFWYTDAGSVQKINLASIEIQ